MVTSETKTLRGEAIQIRRACLAVAISAENVTSMIVSQDENEVRLVRCSTPQGGSAQPA